MAAIGLVLVMFGGLTLWSALTKNIVFDVLRGFIGATPTNRTATGAAA